MQTKGWIMGSSATTSAKAPVVKESFGGQSAQDDSASVVPMVWSKRYEVCGEAMYYVLYIRGDVKIWYEVCGMGKSGSAGFTGSLNYYDLQ